jgi:hypothetical protein
MIVIWQRVPLHIMRLWMQAYDSYTAMIVPFVTVFGAAQSLVHTGNVKSGVGPTSDGVRDGVVWRIGQRLRK